MSVFKVNVVAANPRNEQLTTAPLEALVDTGSELTWLNNANFMNTERAEGKPTIGKRIVLTVLLVIGGATLAFFLFR